MTFFPQFLLGNAGMPRRYYDYAPRFQSLHVISTVGSWILGAAMILTLGIPAGRALPRRARRRESLGLAQLRVAHAVAAAQAQLRREPVFARDPYDYTVPAEESA